MYPKRPAIEKGGKGEDAFAYSNTFAMVADGVGGWTNKGIDSGIFSRGLC